MFWSEIFRLDRGERRVTFMAETNIRPNKTGPTKNEGATPVEGKLDRFLITKEYYELKTRIHDRLLSLIDLSP